MSPHNVEGDDQTERNSSFNRNGMHHYKSFSSFLRIKKLQAEGSSLLNGGAQQRQAANTSRGDKNRILWRSFGGSGKGGIFTAAQPVIVHEYSNKSSKNMMVEECTEGPHE